MINLTQEEQIQGIFYLKSRHFFTFQKMAQKQNISSLLPPLAALLTFKIITHENY